MNTSNDSQQPDDPLTDAYREASAAEAGRPSETTRRAIMAAAQAAANRRAPVANDSRYLWRGVAGVAVIGVAVMLWRQMDHQLPGQAPMVAATSSESSAEPAPALAADRAESKAISPPAALPQAPATNSARVAAAQPAAPAQSLPPALAPSPATAPESEISTLQRAANESAAGAADIAGVVAPSESRSDSAERRSTNSLSALATAPQPLSDPNAALLRERFPQQNQSDTPRYVWLIREATGPVLLSGELAAGQRPEDLLPQLADRLGGRTLGAWRVEEVVNARGQVIRIAIAEAR